MDSKLFGAFSNSIFGSRLIVVAIIAVGVFFGVWNAYFDSPTFDEIAHIPAAYTYLKFHDLRYNPEHPPLIKDLAGLPLLFQNISFDTSANYWTQGDQVTGQWDAGRQLLLRNHFNEITFSTRLPVVAIYAVLGVFIFWWAKKLAGLRAGYLALIFYTFSPLVLGHNHLVTTDLGIAAFTLFSFYFFIEWLKNPTPKSSTLAGLFIGLALLAKFTSLFSLPVFLGVTIIYAIAKHKCLRLTAYGLLLVAVAAITVYGVYAANSFAMPASSLARIIDHPSWFGAPEESATHNFLSLLNNNSVSRPIAAYALGIEMVLKEAKISGSGEFFFLGKDYLHNRWYFPALYLLKETVGFLALLVVSLILWIRRQWRSFHPSKWLTEHLTETILLAYVILYLATAIQGDLYFGIRHILPIIPIIYFLVAIFLARLKLKRMSLFIIIGLVVLSAIESISAFPYHLSFYNFMAGGPKAGYKYAVDSNTDWGQDLKRLDAFAKKHPEITEEPVYFDYFGQVDPKYYLGFKYTWWHAENRPIKPGWYIISASLLQTNIHSVAATGENSYLWLTGHKPDYLVGTSFLVYHVTQAP